MVLGRWDAGEGLLVFFFTGEAGGDGGDGVDVFGLPIGDLLAGPGGLRVAGVREEVVEGLGEAAACWGLVGEELVVVVDGDGGESGEVFEVFGAVGPRTGACEFERLFAGGCDLGIDALGFYAFDNFAGELGFAEVVGDGELLEVVRGAVVVLLIALMVAVGVCGEPLEVFGEPVLYGLALGGCPGVGELEQLEGVDEFYEDECIYNSSTASFASTWNGLGVI